ncbi:translation initiation factor IF-1 [Candidatus Parcubacteria bacterium]|nr:translation initiation factor IF-1 [Candidatus Parcubacteria bacterium]
MDHKKDKDTSVLGVVTEALPDTLFRVKIDGQEEELLTYLSGKMRLNRIRVLIGDKVRVELDPYGGKGRIVQRL